MLVMEHEIFVAADNRLSPLLSSSQSSKSPASSMFSLLFLASPATLPPVPPLHCVLPPPATFCLQKRLLFMETSQPSRTNSFAKRLTLLDSRLLPDFSCVNSRTTTNPQAELGAIFALFQDIGLNDKETDLILRRNEELMLIPIDSVRDRVVSLKSVGIDGLALSHLIAKCPYVLTSEAVPPLVSFIEDELEGKVDPNQLKKLFMTTEPLFLVGFDKKVTLLMENGVSKEKIVHVLNNVNLIKAFCLKPIEQIERLITFLSHYGGVELIVRRPSILNFDLEEQLIPRVEYLLEISGGDKDATGTVLRKLPAILSYSKEHTSGHVLFLNSFAGLDDLEVFKIMLVFPNMISASKERKLQPRIDFLKQCGLDSTEMFKFLTKAPLFLALSFRDNLSHKLGVLVKIGYKYRTKDLAVAVGAVTRISCENLQKVIALFLSYGFSCADIVSMSKKHPQILQYNPSSLEEKMDYLVEEMGRELEELLSFPAFLGYGLDRRIKHRYEMKKKIAGEGMSLNKLLTVSTERFGKKTVREPGLSRGRSE